MPKSCAAWSCTSHQMKDENLNFSIFPDKSKHRDRWEKWVQAVRRVDEVRVSATWEPGSKLVYLCGKHFITGASNKDAAHPDHVPSLFPHKETDERKNEERLRRYSNIKKRTETPKTPVKKLMCKNSKSKLTFSEAIVVKNVDTLPLIDEEIEINSKRKCDTGILISTENIPNYNLRNSCAKNTKIRLDHRMVTQTNDTDEITTELITPSDFIHDVEEHTIPEDHTYSNIPCGVIINEEVNTPSDIVDKETPKYTYLTPEVYGDHTYSEIQTATPFHPNPSVPDPITPATHSTGLSHPLHNAERDMLNEEINNLRKEKRELDEKLANKTEITFSSIENKDEETKFLTGLSSSVFLTIFTALSTFMTGNKIRSLSLQNQFLMTLIKYRLNIPFEYLATQNNISCATASKIFWRWSEVMYAKLSFLVRWSDREVIRKTIPPVFKAYFPRMTGIMDCFEIFTERPKGLLARAKIYSNYKKHSTVKVLIVCSPNGAINFMSNCWGDRVSDIEIVRQSGLLTLPDHMPGDQILADRGFTLHDDFACSGVELLIPSFTKGKKQLSAQEVESSRQLAAVRIHIERVIGLMKNRFTILHGPVPLNLVKSMIDELNSAEVCSYDQILRNCGSLTNLGDGIVYTEK